MIRTSSRVTHGSSLVTRQEVMMDGEEGTTKYAKGAKREAKLLCGTIIAARCRSHRKKLTVSESPTSALRFINSNTSGLLIEHFSVFRAFRS
jgi:hypothetical protein